MNVIKLVRTFSAAKIRTFPQSNIRQCFRCFAVCYISRVRFLCVASVDNHLQECCAVNSRSQYNHFVMNIIFRASLKTQYQQRL